jgi:hypothetical protein
MKKITLLRIMLIGLVVIAGTHLAFATNYAVLIEGDSPTGFDEFWNDTFLMYEILIDNGFDPDNIFVLYYNGTDHASANPRYQPGSPENSHIAGPITDYAATIANVTLVFNGLANVDPLNGIPQMTGNDFLFVWVFDHGGFDDTNSNWVHDPGEPTYLGLVDGDIYATTFASLVDSISYSRRVFVMQQCHSGGFIPNLSNNNTVIITAAGLENAYPADDSPTTENEIVGGVTYRHGEFNYQMMNALHWLTPTRNPITAQDTNGNRSPSMFEVFNWVQTHESQIETPQYNDPGGIGDFVHIACLEPGEEVDIFIRDHHYWIDPLLLVTRPPDDGSVPSNLHGEYMWISPDILVDSNLDGIADLNPEYGQENYIYANVCNINAPTAGPINAIFYWADPTVGLSWPTDWNLIGTGTITSLSPGNCTTTPHSASDHVSWYPPNPSVNSHYCLLAVLSAPGDPAITLSGSIVNNVANDNNIAWRNVTVIDAYAGYTYDFEVYVANPFEIPKEIEFGIVGVPKGMRVRASVEGEKVQVPIIIGEGAERQKSSIHISLNAHEKRKVTLHIAIPHNAKPGTNAFITAFTKLDGKVMGGYTYEVRICEKEKARGRGLRLSFHLGATYPLGFGSNPYHDEYPNFTNLNEIADSNVHFRFNLEYAFSKRFNFMAFLGFNQFTDDYKASVHYYWFNVSANLKMLISSPSSTGLKWYLQFGPGIYIPKKNLLPPNPTTTTYGGNIGLGAQIPISGPFDLEWGIDLNCTNFYSSSEPKYWFLTLQLGMLFR